MAHTHYRTKGIFLKKEDKGEADQLFTLFSEDFGRLEVLGRAIRKIKSKLRSSAELFYFSEIEFIQGKNYKTLTDAILIDKFKNLRGNPEKLEIAYKMADALNSLSGKEEKEPKIWQLLLAVLKNLNICKLELENSLKIEDCKLKIIYYYFLWNLFSILGYAPQLYHCPVCQKKLAPETFYFVPGEGGVVCWQCLAKIKKQRQEVRQQGEIKSRKENDSQFEAGQDFWREIRVDTVKLLRFFVQESINKVGKLRVEKEELSNLEEISELYLCFLLDRGFVSQV